MQSRKEDRRRAARSGRPELKKAGEGSSGIAAASTITSTTTIVTESGQTLTISDLVTRFDEAAKRRINNMNQKLRRLEMQMEVLEAEMSRTNDPSKWS